MIASGVSQYLHPDYLQPLPTTLDAKKSPLAMLAQTCSSIGKDPTPSKSIIPPLDKKEKEAAEKAAAEDKRPSSHGNKGSSNESGRDSSSKPGFRTIPPKDIPPLVPISGDKTNDSNSGSSKSISSSCSSSETSSLCTTSSSSSHSLLSSSSNQRPVSATGSSSQRSTSRSGSVRDAADYSSCTPPASSSSSFTRHSASASPPSSKMLSAPHSSMSHGSLASLPKPSVTHPSLIHGLGHHPLAAAYPHLSLLHSLDPAVQSYHNALAAHSGLGSLAAAAAMAQSSAAAAAAAALKAGATGASALSPYVAYARVRTPSGATTLVPVCRDPFCSNCQLTLQNSHLSSACTAPGCSQCAHEKSLTNLTNASLAGLNLLPHMSSASSLTSSMAGLSSLHSHLYPMAAHQGLTYQCNWVSNTEYCGNRFGSSEDLLQHLRTHTTALASSAEASSLAATYSALGLHPGLAAAAAASHYPGSPLSPNSLRRAYPTSLSPVSSLLSAGRYHPYKSPLGGVPPPGQQGLPAVGPYYSPYALYGQRIGAAAVP